MTLTLATRLIYANFSHIKKRRILTLPFSIHSFFLGGGGCFTFFLKHDYYTPDRLVQKLSIFEAGIKLFKLNFTPAQLTENN